MTPPDETQPIREVRLPLRSEQDAIAYLLRHLPPDSPDRHAALIISALDRHRELAILTEPAPVRDPADYPYMDAGIDVPEADGAGGARLELRGTLVGSTNSARVAVRVQREQAIALAGDLIVCALRGRQP